MEHDEYSYEPGDVYMVEFPYEEHNGRSDRRPVIIIVSKDDNGNIKCAKITSSLNRKKEHDFIIQDKKSAGLGNDSLVELNRIELVNEREFFRKLGEISDEDFETMVNNMEKIYEESRG